MKKVSVYSVVWAALIWPLHGAAAATRTIRVFFSCVVFACCVALYLLGSWPASDLFALAGMIYVVGFGQAAMTFAYANMYTVRPLFYLLS